MSRTWLIAATVLSATALTQQAWAESDFQRAQSEFVCDPEAEAAESTIEDDLFDESELPSVVTAVLGLEPPQEEAGEVDPADVPVEDADDAEIQAWREAVERYEIRTLEFAEEVNRLIGRKYDEEFLELRDGYERLIGRADLEERQLRDSAITAHERFVKEHPDSPYTARRMFRLAELYFEKADEEFIAANERYDEIVDLFDAGKVDFLPEPPLKDLRRSIALYKKIIRKFPSYEQLGVVYYTLGYCYSDETSRHLDPERAEETYVALLDNVADSPYRAQAYFRLGDLYFEEGFHERALSYYGAIVEEFEKGSIDFENRQQARLYELALYKYAWAFYKIDKLPTAIARFMTLLQWAELKEAATGKVADLKPESVRYLAISFSDMAIEQAVSPIDYAAASLQEKMDEPWAFDVLIELASILRDQARLEEAIAAYQYLQRVQPLHPLGPEFQNNVTVLYQNLVIPDPDAAADARVALTDRYGLDSAWFAANKNNKEATGLAEKYILESLQFVAFTYHTKAQQSGDPADYLLAAQKYVEYLERYPFADNAYELNYYLADCYLFAGSLPFDDSDGNPTTGWEAAIKQFASLFGFPEREHQRDAILGILYSYNFIWSGGDGKTIAQTPEAIVNIAPPMGQKVEFSKVDLTPEEVDYIRAIRWVQREVGDFEDLPVLLFDVGQIYFYKNHLDRARAVFMELIEEHPKTDYASFGAGLIVDSYLYTGDLARMRDTTERFAMLELGEDVELQSERNELFSTLAKKSLFKDGELAYGFERYECALLSFLEYYELYGTDGTDDDPQQIDDIIYNIALSYTKVGKAQDSTRYYEILLDRFPHSEQAPKTFWKMAQNYEQLFELDKAVGYYDDLMRFHPTHDDVPNALYNSGFLAIGLERFADAARAYEKYHDAYDDKEESPLLLFRAAELWEADGNRREARRVFERWLDRYGETDADRWVETRFKLAGFDRERGRDRDADRQIQAIVDSFPVMREELIKDGGSIGLKIVARIAFQPLVEEFERYSAYAVPDTQDIAKLEEFIDRKVEWNSSVADAFDAFVVQYPDFEWQTAALYHKALSFQNHGQTWLKAPNPFDPDSEDMDEVDRYFLYIEELIRRAKPFEDSAVDQYKQTVAFAKEKKRYTVWIGKALEALSKVDPNAYPVPKPESTTVIPSDSVTLPPLIQEVEQSSSLLPTDNGVRFADAEARQ